MGRLRGGRGAGSGDTVGSLVGVGQAEGDGVLVVAALLAEVGGLGGVPLLSVL